MTLTVVQFVIFTTLIHSLRPLQSLHYLILPSFLRIREFLMSLKLPLALIVLVLLFLQ